MFRYLRYLKNPAVVMRYADKHLRLRIRQLAYSIRKRLGIQLSNKQMKVLPRRFSLRNSQQLEAQLMSLPMRVFLSTNFKTALHLIGEDQEYRSRIFAQAEKVLEDDFYFLYKQHPGMFDKTSGHYRWNEDFEAAYVYLPSHYSLTRKVNSKKGADIKQPWEMARMQYLFAPALAFRLSGDERYAQKVKHILSDFILQNEPGEGPAWNISMEVGIRAANMVLAVELIRPAACVDGPFLRLFANAINEHRKHILANEENTGGRTSNHYLGGLLGLAACGACFPDMRGSKEALEYAFSALEKEIATQILPDGGDYEGSTSYQRLVGELLAFTTLACASTGREINTASRKRLQAMADFTRALTAPSGLVPQVGDNDSGRVFQLLPEETNDHRSYVNLIYTIVSGRQAHPGLQDGFHCFHGLSDQDTLPMPATQAVSIFTDFGIARAAVGPYWLVTSAIDAQRFGMGGHTHNDLLSFEIHVAGHPVVVDPGTGCYTGDRKLKHRMRSAGSHSTLRINGLEPRVGSVSRVFSWDSKVSGTSLGVVQHESGIQIQGQVSAYGHNLPFTLRREIALDTAKVVVTDQVEGEVQELLMTLPLSPMVEVIEVQEHSCLLRVGNTEVRLEGSWFFSPDKQIYSEGYNMTVETSSILCQSNHSKNWLEFSTAGGYAP